MGRSRFESELRQGRRPQSIEALREAGVPKSTLRGKAWRRTSQGFYLPADPAIARTPTQRILEAAPRVPVGGAFGGWAAAYIQGADWLDGLNSSTMDELPVPICTGAGTHRASSGSVVFHRESLEAADVVMIRGLPVTRPIRTAFDGVRWAPRLEEAVAFLDAVLHQRLCSIPALAAYLQAHPARPGIDQARRAIVLADDNVRSTWESRLRVCYQIEAGLPRPLTNKPIFDPRGKLLGIPDLFDPIAGLVTEFDDQDHRTRLQHHRDNVREERFEAANLTVTRTDSLDLRLHRTELVRRMQSGYRRGSTRDTGKDRWTLIEPAWWLKDEEVELTNEQKAELFG